MLPQGHRNSVRSLAICFRHPEPYGVHIMSREKSSHRGSIFSVPPTHLCGSCFLIKFSEVKRENPTWQAMTSLVLSCSRQGREPLWSWQPRCEGGGQPPALPGNWNLFLIATYKTKKNLREIWGWGGRARWPGLSKDLPHSQAAAGCRKTPQLSFGNLCGNLCVLPPCFCLWVSWTCNSNPPGWFLPKWGGAGDGLFIVPLV